MPSDHMYHAYNIMLCRQICNRIHMPLLRYLYRASMRTFQQHQYKRPRRVLCSWYANAWCIWSLFSPVQISLEPSQREINREVRVEDACVWRTLRNTVYIWRCICATYDESCQCYTSMHVAIIPCNIQHVCCYACSYLVQSQTPTALSTRKKGGDPNVCVDDTRVRGLRYETRLGLWDAEVRGELRSVEGILSHRMNTKWTSMLTMDVYMSWYVVVR